VRDWCWCCWNQLGLQAGLHPNLLSPTTSYTSLIGKPPSHIKLNKEGRALGKGTWMKCNERPLQHILTYLNDSVKVLRLGFVRKIGEGPLEA
jgi:hypothetical protein